MENWTRKDLDRVSGESSARIVAAHKSCEDTADHIASSRQKVARTLDVLRERFWQLRA